MNSLTEIQKQIKAFNKAFSRAEAAGTLSDEFYAQITDLIDYDRMTKKGYAKAGKKYLENLSYKDLLAYSSDIKQAKSLIDLSNLVDKFDITDIEGAKDYKSLLWTLYDKIDEHKNFDSDYVYKAVEGENPVDLRKLALEMYKYLNNPDYGLSDFDEWYQSHTGLEG